MLRRSGVPQRGVLEPVIFESSHCFTHRGTDEAVARLVEHNLQNGAIQNDGDEKHQHHRNLHTGCST